MKKRKVEYMGLIIVFFLILFGRSIDNLFLKTMDKLNVQNICDNTYQELQKENETLKELLNFKETLTDNYMVSKVKYRDIYDFQNEITILRGKNDNLVPGLAVVNAQGLIGTIKKVDATTSTVRLLTNKESNVSVKINNSYGLLKVIDNKVVVSNITNYENINVGDDIYTSGIGTLPNDILIGKVAAINLDSLGIEQIISVSLAVDFNLLNYVFIIGEV